MYKMANKHYDFMPLCFSALKLKTNLSPLPKTKNMHVKCVEHLGLFYTACPLSQKPWTKPYNTTSLPLNIQS